MFSRIYYLNKEKTHYIKICWEPVFKNLTVIENGIVIGKFNNLKEAQKGKIFILSEGKEFFVRLDWGWFQRNDIRRFEILLDGEHIKGSIGHPREILISLIVLIAMMVLFYIAAAFWVKVHGKTVSDLSLGAGIYSVVLSVIFFILGCFVIFRYSKKELIFIAIILLTDILFTLLAPKGLAIHFKSFNLVNLSHISSWDYIFKSIYFVLLLLFILDFNQVKLLKKLT